ncbi:MAG TPA: hypothetical protein VJV74_08525 [Terriglobia bacterium]|nr:hypothetical protein [Terriglobia bacterium]
MKRSIIYSAAFVLALYLCPAASWAQHGHGGGGGMGHGAMGAHGAEMGNRDGSARSSASGMKGAKSPDQMLASNPKLSSRLQGLLPPHINLQDAARGFKNLGQFVAAVHVSHNLGIPFDQLKSMMTGTRHDSLGKAIHTLKPDVDSKAEAKQGVKQADEDIRETQS